MSRTGERLYNVDDNLLETVRREQAWTADPKYFKKVKISPSAIVKMMVHGQSGVDKGIKKSGKPIEVMGMLVGRPDTEDRNTVVISDAQPLPIEGFETKVIAGKFNIPKLFLVLILSFYNPSYLPIKIHTCTKNTANTNISL